jgi:hypothetical protein
MAKYQVITTPQSDTINKVKAYYNFLQEKKHEEITFDHDELSEGEAEAYVAGWRLAMAVAQHNLTLWFPEAEVKVNG